MNKLKHVKQLMKKERESDVMRLCILRAMVNNGRYIICEDCKSVDCLTLHHGNYDRYTINDLYLLCWPCHLKRHNKKTEKMPDNWWGIYTYMEKGKRYVSSKGMRFEID